MIKNEKKNLLGKWGLVLAPAFLTISLVVGSSGAFAGGTKTPPKSDLPQTVLDGMGERTNGCGDKDCAYTNTGDRGDKKKMEKHIESSPNEIPSSGTGTGT